MALSSAAPWHQLGDAEMDPTDNWAQSWICCKAKKAPSIILVHERHPRDSFYFFFLLRTKDAHSLESQKASLNGTEWEVELNKIHP